MIALLLAGLLFAAGCAPPETPGPTATATPGVTLMPFDPIGEAPAATETPSPPASPTPPPTPTSTPFFYVIVEGDTLIGVAFRYGITLAELLAANPGIDPQFLSIGESLVIPLPENPGGSGLPTPSGSVIPAGTPICYPTADGGLWCFARFENAGNQAMDSIAAQVSIYDREGERLAAKPAISSVNLLPPGGSIPVGAWFPGAAGDYAQVNAVLTSALPVQEEDPRYAPITSEYAVKLNGDQAKISGHIEGEFREARISAAAIGPDGAILGVRLLQFDGAAGEMFAFDVYSLAGDIERVDVLVEAYP